MLKKYLFLKKQNKLNLDWVEFACLDGS